MRAKQPPRQQQHPPRARVDTAGVDASTCVVADLWIQPMWTCVCKPAAGAKDGPTSLREARCGHHMDERGVVDAPGNERSGRVARDGRHGRQRAMGGARWAVHAMAQCRRQLRRS